MVHSGGARFSPCHNQRRTEKQLPPQRNGGRFTCGFRCNRMVAGISRVTEINLD
uniref:Uncharacterized protein n=1 Tax=Nelumbo nucifera TaxID=4432 RepID=A0A822YKT2_NELNU|nr:TPA_asm: hypothetical protein HUJ06_010750 [Nelumbo nucifera]